MASRSWEYTAVDGLATETGASVAHPSSDEGVDR
jgi:hypothetical protein